MPVLLAALGVNHSRREGGEEVSVRLRFRLAMLVGILALFTNAIHAQQKGQYLPGQQGLNAGVMPEQGFTYVNMVIDYSADSLNDARGNPIPLIGSYDIWAIENIYYYVLPGKVLGGKFGVMAAIPIIANGSVTLGSVNFPNVAINAGGFGVSDSWIQPATLGWSGKRIDTYIGYGFVAPTGRYTPGATDNLGSGYWGHNVMNGTTVYLTKNKGTTANLFSDWEIHGSKSTGQGTTITPGQAFTIEWGFGQALPLKKDLSQLLQIGLIGYDQWQLTENDGLLAPLIPANAVPFYSVHAIGFQTNYILPAKGINLFFKYENEYKALARPQGRTIVFGGSWTIKFPKKTQTP